VLKVRTTKTASKNTAVQVVSRSKQRTKVVKHIGTAKTPEELLQLLDLARQYVYRKNNTPPLFPESLGADPQKHLVAVENLKFINAYHKFAYGFLSYFYELNNFASLNDDLLKDLAIIRIIEPASKIRSIELLKGYFGIKYSRNSVYRGLLKIKELKPEIEKCAIEYAKNNLAFDFSLVFYDVTTLYFETFGDDEFRKCGFSKDNKVNQPQILIALVVNKDGYPIAIDIFAGNKFEGHTIIPVILKFKETYDIENLTVVADAAMLSRDNIQELEQSGLNYIVAARLSNLSEELLVRISKHINNREGKYFQEKTPYGLLICDYLEKRAAKNRAERKKQILKAQEQIANPGKLIKRLRFVKETTKSVYKLNEDLIKKDKRLDGLKGYYTNINDISASLVVSRYKDLWIIEKSFRIAKSDLLARPIFHRQKEKIEAHVLIVFLSLCVTKTIEMLTGLSVKRVKDLIWSVLDIEFIDILTNKRFFRRMETPNNEMVEFLKQRKKLVEY
jgi:transposase